MIALLVICRSLSIAVIIRIDLLFYKLIVVTAFCSYFCLDFKENLHFREIRPLNRFHFVDLVGN
jgi:hypothetical protein